MLFTHLLNTRSNISEIAGRPVIKLCLLNCDISFHILSCVFRVCWISTTYCFVGYQLHTGLAWSCTFSYRCKGTVSSQFCLRIDVLFRLTCKGRGLSPISFSHNPEEAFTFVGHLTSVTPNLR